MHYGGGTRSRTEVDGFAIRCMATLPFRRKFGASNEVRTRDLDLGKVALYQLSYTRVPLFKSTYLLSFFKLLFAR